MKRRHSLQHRSASEVIRIGGQPVENPDIV